MTTNCGATVHFRWIPRLSGAGHPDLFVNPAFPLQPKTLYGASSGFAGGKI
jgi:hypothetical protein